MMNGMADQLLVLFKFRFTNRMRHKKVGRGWDGRESISHRCVVFAGPEVLVALALAGGCVYKNRRKICRFRQ